MSNKIFTLSKKERLCSRKTFENIFEQGKGLSIFPLKILWIVNPGVKKIPVETAFVVSKKKINLAVKRNLVKRRMREAYRQNKHILYEPLINKANNYSIIILYFHNDILKYKDIETALVKAFQKFLLVIETGN